MLTGGQKEISIWIEYIVDGDDGRLVKDPGVGVGR